MRRPRSEILTSLRALIGALLLTGCLQSATVPCNDGRLCPEGTQCEPTFGLCVVPEQLTACGDDGAVCSFGTKFGLCRSGVCVELVCGDGVRIGDEECDGDDLDGATCESLHFYETNGPVVCTSHCTYETSQCAGVCGDGVAQEDSDEACDTGEDVSVVVATCQDFGFYDPGDVTCTNRCTMSFAACTGYCGDGELNGGEFCEGAADDLPECINFGFDVGDTTCSDDCAPAFANCKYMGWRRDVAALSSFLDVWVRADNEFWFASLNGVARSTGGVTTETDLGATMSDIFGLAANDAWAVGLRTIAHFDGTTWSSTDVSTLIGTNLLGVWAASPTNAFAVGPFSTMLHYDGTGWSTITPPATGAYLVAVHGTSATNAIAVGHSGTAFHFDGTQWQEKSTGTSSHLNDVWAAAANDAWAVGDSGTLLRFNGTSWVVQPSLGNGTLFSVWGRAADDVYVTANNGYVFHYDGFSWWRLNTGTSGLLVAVHGTTSSVHVLHGSLGLFHHSGASWSGETFPDVSEKAWVGPQPSDVRALGSQGVYRKTTAGWSDMNAPNSGAFLEAMWSDGTTTFVGTEDAAVIHHDGVSWSTPVTLPRSALGAVTGLWGSSAANVFAATANGYIFRTTNGTTWTEETTPPGNLRAIWGSSVNDVYAVGWSATNLGAILHRNPTTSTWSSIALPALPLLLDVWGTSSNNIFVVGLSGTILHFDGVNWSRMSTPVPFDLRGVGGSSPTDVFAVGAESTVLHFDGTSWSEVRWPSSLPAGLQLNDVAVRDDLVVITGANGQIYALDRPGPW